MSLFISKINEVIKSTIDKNNLVGEYSIERAKNNNGDFSTNFALINGKANGKNPIELAELLASELSKSDIFKKVEVAKPGFINLYMTDSFLQAILTEVFTKKEKFGAGEKKNFKYDLEIVSANPTGFLHIGHARNGVIGDSVARIMKFNGYDVETEYYTNDAGNQINILACTMYYKYLTNLGIECEKPEEMYGGDMYDDAAKLFIEKYGDKFVGYEMKDNKITNEEAHMIFREEFVQYFLKEIKKQLIDLEVNVDIYTSEKAMYDNNEIEKTLSLYRDLNKTYIQDDAVWLKTTEFGDDKDRVLIKSDGSYTYITPDLACHNIRFQRSKADHYVNFWGGDHHGYINRMRAGLALLGYDFNVLDFDMIQMVRLMKDGQEYKMSKRRGTAVWLIDLQEMIGKDSLRYILASKAPSSHMDFDLDLALAHNSTNPVYYAQYATARAFKLLQKADSLNINKADSYELLEAEKERELMVLINSFEEQVTYAAKNRLPVVICDYIQSLSKAFHSYYAEFTIVDDKNNKLSAQRVALVKAVRITLENAFSLIGIDTKENM